MNEGPRESCLTGAFRGGDAENILRKHNLRSILRVRTAQEEGMIQVKMKERKQRRRMMPSIDA